MTEKFENYEMRPVDPDTAKLAGECAADIATNLGESPEAWRGAALMAHFIKAVSMADIEACLDATGDLDISEATVTALLTVGFLEKLPMWPTGITGEPLVSDDAPLVLRPHFQWRPND